TTSAAPTGTTGTTGTTRSTGTATNGTAAAPGSEGCTVIPEETAGPYPGDGTNGPDALTQPGIVRSDIRSSVPAGGATAEGVPLTITIALSDTTDGCQ